MHVGVHSCVSVCPLLHYICEFDCIHTQLFASMLMCIWLEWSAPWQCHHAIQLHLPLWWQASWERVHGEEGFCVNLYLTLHWSVRVLRGIALERTLVFAVQPRWVSIDTRPPLVKPRCPCFIRHPTGSPALLIGDFRQLASRPSSSGLWPYSHCCWRNPVHSRTSAFLTDGYMGGLSKASRFLQTCKSSVNFLVSR